MRKMKTLELNPLKTKKLHLFLLEHQHDQPWWFIASILKDETPIPPLLKVPESFIQTVKKLVETELPNLVTDELYVQGSTSNATNPLKRVLSALGVPYRDVDMDDFASSYLAHSIHLKVDRRDGIKNDLLALYEMPDTSGNRIKIDQLTDYRDTMTELIENELQELECEVRLNWIAMNILHEAAKIEGQLLKVIHLCSPNHVKSLTKILESLNVEVTHVALQSIPELVQSRSELMKDNESLASVKIRSEINHVSLRSSD